MAPVRQGLSAGGKVWIWQCVSVRPPEMVTEELGEVERVTQVACAPPGSS